MCFPFVNKTFKPEKLDVVSDLSSAMYTKHLTGSQRCFMYAHAEITWHLCPEPSAVLKELVFVNGDSVQPL